MGLLFLEKVRQIELFQVFTLAKHVLQTFYGLTRQTLDDGENQVQVKNSIATNAI